MPSSSCLSASCSFHHPQAADRILLITEAQQAPNPSLRLPAAAAATASEQSEAEAAGARPDLVLQHVKLPQHYVDAAYPLVRCLGNLSHAGQHG